MFQHSFKGVDSVAVKASTQAKICNSSPPGGSLWFTASAYCAGHSFCPSVIKSKGFVVTIWLYKTHMLIPLLTDVRVLCACQEAWYSHHHKLLNAMKSHSHVFLSAPPPLPHSFLPHPHPPAPPPPSHNLSVFRLAFASSPSGISSVLQSSHYLSVSFSVTPTDWLAISSWHLDILPALFSISLAPQLSLSPSPSYSNFAHPL